MALLIRTLLEFSILFCFAFNVETCCGSKEIKNDPAAVWLLQATDSVDKVDHGNSFVYSSETKASDQTSVHFGSHRLSNRPVHHSTRPRGNELRKQPFYPKGKNPAKPNRPVTQTNLSKKLPSNEVHIEVDSLDEIGDLLNELLNNDDLDVQINAAPGKNPDVPSGAHSKRRPSASPYIPRHTTTERPAIRTLPPVGRRPYFATPKPPSHRSQHTTTTKDPYENFWLPPSTIRVRTYASATPREGDLKKQTTEPPRTAQHDTAAVISTIANQEGAFSQSPWEWFNNSPFWGPPLALTSPFPKTTTEPTKSHAKKRPIKHNDSNDEEDEEIEDEYSEEEDDESDDEDQSKTRHTDENERPFASSSPPVVVASALPKTTDYSVQPYHIPPTNYYTSQSPVRLDFSPIFLALIPIALFLGAAASFALSSAVTSSSAVATAQQQQQQQEGNNNNANNANNNNANTILELFSALYQNNNNGNFNNFPYFVVVNDTSIIGRRKRRRAKRHIEQFD